MTTVKEDKRFAFGENWSRFLEVLNEDRVEEAEISLKNILQVDDLSDKTFLDIGSGSGLFSLAARRIGASVRSFDYDQSSVACTQELRKRYFPDDMSWIVERGDALNSEWLNSLGQYDIVYSWGVLHHTGQMWRALGNAAGLVKPGGKLLVAIYNDQGRKSRWWHFVKHTYTRLPPALRFLVTIPSLAALWGPASFRDLLIGKPFATWRNYARSRGMSPWHDLVDWVGGYPFEVAKPEEIFEFFHKLGYSLEGMTTCGGGHGCNQFLFVLEQPISDTAGT